MRGGGGGTVARPPGKTAKNSNSTFWVFKNVGLLPDGMGSTDGFIVRVKSAVVTCEPEQHLVHC